MKRLFSLVGLLAMFVVSVQPATGSSPAIVGEISGVELCPQLACGAAVFTGTCECEVDNQRTLGFFWIAVQHDPLPNPFLSSSIFAGKWNLTTLNGKFSGNVVEGSIFNNNDNTFTVTVRLRLEKDGTGDVFVSGLLDHRDFPPTFEGILAQPLF